MISASLNSIVRSSLEEMLINLHRRDENDEKQPKDFPPELPSRPKPTRKARLPSFKRTIPIVEDNKNEQENSDSGNNNVVTKKVVVKKKRKISFGGKKVKDSDGSESPYILSPEKNDFGITKDDLNQCSSVGKKKTEFLESQIDDNIGYFIRKKLRVWCRLRNGKYESGHIQSTSIDKATVKLLDGSAVTVPTVNLSPANPDILEGVDDLIQLSYLNEPSVLHNLQHRYSRNMIYSKAGPVLVAINPFKKLEIYGNEQIMAYREKLEDSPHVYVIADAAYSEVLSDEVNQSIIISGESGAGKTETAKIAMQYLATLGGGSNGIQSEILQTNFILEAFGNAKTCRNDNSSRFGKLIEIHFSATGKLGGAKIQTCLLEKSRVVQVAMGERSYHIFYQLCAGAPSDLRDKLKLRTAYDYYYLNQSKCLTINNVDDADRFHKLTAALRMLKISKEDQEHAFEMLVAVLWLGNISFSVIDNENHIEVLDDEATEFSASLLGCSAKDLMLALSTHKIQAGKDKVSKRLTLQEAINARDALAKFIYANLFDWLVEEINKSLAVGKNQTGRSISILDIYGFESLKKNSFEQLCINYANERLQQHFNRHLFKLEQEEYELDGIDWTKVDFVDNQVCLDLFEKKPIGLISLLDEESKFPRATDLTFANKVKQHLDSNCCFRGVRGGSFGVLHSSGEVIYDTSGFLDKNRDSLHSDTIQLLSLCQGILPRAFASVLLNQSLKQSVATKFKGQLFNLMQRLASTTPHFIRCIKPNSKQIPYLYENETVLEQLRCCGVLEVVRIARSGYPTRLTHQEFTRRYGFLLLEDCASEDPLSISVSILRQFNILPEMYQVGYTKLYFRAGQIGSLERLRRQFLQGILEVQKCFRGHRVRRYFNELRGGVIALQSIIRGESCRRKYTTLLKLKEQDDRDKLEQQLRAAVLIQSGIRGWLAQSHLRRLQSSRKEVQKLREQAAHNKLEQRLIAAVQIQSGIRGWLAQNHLDKLQSSRKKVQKLKEQQLSAVVQIQSGLGRLQSSRNLEHYMHKDGRKIADVENLPKEMLISIIEELHRRIDTAEDTLSQKEKENTEFKEQVRVLEARQSEYKVKTKVKEAGDTLSQKQKKNAAVKDQVRQLEKQRSEYKPKIISMDAEGALSQKEKENKALRDQVRHLEKQRSEYKSKIKSMELTWKKEKESLQLRLVEAKMSLGAEYSSGQLRKADCSSPSAGGSSKKHANKGLNSVAVRETNGDPQITINQLRSEFEKNKVTLNEKAKRVLDVNSGQPKRANHVQEYRQLKLQFESFSRGFKVQLKQVRAEVFKPRHKEGDRSCQKCWGKSNI